MTVPGPEHGFTEEGDFTQDANTVGVDAVPVIIKGTEVERVAPEFAGFTTVSVPRGDVIPTPIPAQLLNRRYARYKAKFFVTNLNGATSYVINTNINALAGSNPQGGTYTGTGKTIPDFDSMQELYAVAIGGGPVIITVMDETYGQVK